jgi:hypothetical protein
MRRETVRRLVMRSTARLIAVTDRGRATATEFFVLRTMARDMVHTQTTSVGGAWLRVRRGNCVTENAFDPEAMVDAMAPLLGLTLTSESRVQTIAHLRIAAEHAQKLLSVPLEDEDEPAPVFRA